MQNSHIRNTHPAKLLVKSINILPKGRVLDVAMGGEAGTLSTLLEWAMKLKVSTYLKRQ